MKYSEAIKVAMKNVEFANRLDAFKRDVSENHIAGSLQFSIGNEAFYFGGEAVYDLESNVYHVHFKGGKHTEKRAAYLIGKGQTFVIE